MRYDLPINAPIQYSLAMALELSIYLGKCLIAWDKATYLVYNANHLTE
jgi:hypothetical protein